MTPSIESAEPRAAYSDQLIPYEAGQLEGFAAVSYFQHFGPNAVSAAEGDALGEALRYLRALVDLDPEAQPMAYHDAIRSASELLARVTKG